LEGSVEFVPFVQDPAEEYRKARFLVVSSIAEFDGPETFSRVIIEAWAAHRTVVSFAVGGPKYIINPEINGLLVPEKNIAAFAQAMLLLTRDGALRERLALAGFEEVKRRYGADVVADQTLKVIHGRAPV
jgi:glycosyltransferase involved in cell wall biosynthesis